MNKLRNPPLFYTLAQIKFNTIAQMNDYALTIQEHFRLRDYPDFRSINRTDLIVLDNDQPRPETQLFKQQSWHFINNDATEGYILYADALVFHTTIYNSFEDFQKKMLNGINIVHDVINLAFIERIGLRYLNAIQNQQNENLVDYINNSLLGFSCLTKGTLIRSFTETISNLNDNTMIARSIISESGLFIPRDLHPIQLKIQDKFSILEGKLAVLDLDCYTNKRLNFDKENVQDKLLIFNNEINFIFRSAVTEHALKIWS